MTTPQNVAVADVRRALRMFETVAIPVLGIVENMSYFIAPDTGNRYNIFGEGGGERLALGITCLSSARFRWESKCAKAATKACPWSSASPIHRRRRRSVK